MMTGSIAGAWKWGPFHSWRRRERSIPSLDLAGSVLTVVTFLSYSIWATDTWFHVVTKTVSFTQFTPSLDQKKPYGRSLNETCLYDALGPSTCRPTNTIPREPYLAYNNISTQNQILEGSLDNTDVFGTQSFASSELYPLVSTWFSNGSFSTLFEPFPGANRGNFTKISPNITAVPPQTTDANPFHALIAGNFAATDDTMKNAFSADPSFNIVNNQVDYVLDCEVSIYTFQYDFVNGNFASGISTFPESDLVSALLVQTYFSSLGSPTNFGNLMANGAYRSTLLNSSAAFISSFATQISVGLLAEMATVLVPQLNIAEQTRNEILVAEIPFAPLWTLVGLCFICFVLGIGFIVTAVVNSSTASKDVRLRLGIAGVIANWCKVPRYSNADLSMESMFYPESVEKQEHKRVGIARSESGGWIFKTWN
ncbi:hypothetical protein G7Y89_g6107 [Cudoniella acicularis]|uniref:Uncharacterized protein n=1 Tax=Cudoniella acicularis TaxID=354080 RepID=A0A8H4W5U8_9HELO|nr:hypothetical protein G7Y89_g6107 [Cudoniella acicularis]